MKQVLLMAIALLVLSARAAAQTEGEDAWTTVAPGGETTCGFDTPFEFWVREGDPAEVLVYLQGGGACWDHETCHPARRIRFDSRISEADRNQRRTGIFDRAEENPFRTYTMVFVPYCTGDFHLGNRTLMYAATPGESAGDVTVHHHGARNIAAVLGHLSSRPVPPRRIVVTGGSAGAIASPFLAAEVADLFPSAIVRQIGDGTGGLGISEVRGMLNHWGADSLLAARGMPLRTSGDVLAGMYEAAALRHPGIGFSQVNTTLDATVGAALQSFGYDRTAVAANIARTYEELSRAPMCFSGYTIADTIHTVLWRADFLRVTVSGRRLADRLAEDIARGACVRRDIDSTHPLAALSSAAAQFLQSLDPAQRSLAHFAMEDSMRTSWFYVPRERVGLTLARMRPPQRALAHALLRTLLSHTGYLKVNAIIGLEDYLKAVEQDGFVRDAELYVMVVFGTPGTGDPWGFRFEGHHVSVNFTTAGAAHAVATPLFLGANPATVPTGPQAGLRVLAPEEDIARELLGRLTPEQRRAAIVSDTAPPDIFTRNAPSVLPLEPAGLSMTGMSPEQQQLLLRLLDVYAGNLQPGLAAAERTRILDMDRREVRFAWYGSPDVEAPHYYRIQGPGFLIEYDFTSNHVHTVWRDLDRDFGRDLLREHHSAVRHERRR